MIPHHSHITQVIPDFLPPFTKAELIQNPQSAPNTLAPSYDVLMMSIEPSDGATASATKRKIPLPRFLNIDRIQGFFRSQSSDHDLEPPQAASVASQSADVVNVPPTQARATSSNSPHSPAPVTNATPATTPYGKRFLIHNSNGPAYIFPEATAGITQHHIDRFFALQDIFQRNIEKSCDPCIDSEEINYLLRLCGSLENAIPSVVVCCPDEKLTKIKSLFNQPQVKSQYEPDITTPTFVNLGLCFWPKSNKLLALHELAAVIREELDSGDSVPDVVAGLMPWGLRILEGDRGVQHTATMGCVLQVGGDRFGLTTAHVFNHTPATVARHHGEGSRDPDTGDEDYDMSIDSEENTIPFWIENTSLNSLERTVTLGKCQVHTALSLGDTSKWPREHANLDWALIELGLNEGRLPSPATPGDALTIVEHLPQKCTNVLIITRDLPGVPAILYGIPSYIGGAKGSPAAEVWTVGYLPKEHPIRKGQSGSIVVDAESGYLYGMVIAADPFGDIQIVPFAAMLAQVKELFKDEHACLLKAPRYFRFITSWPSLHYNDLLESQKTSDTIVGDRVLPYAESFSQSSLGELRKRFLPDAMERNRRVRREHDLRQLADRTNLPMSSMPGISFTLCCVIIIGFIFTIIASIGIFIGLVITNLPPISLSLVISYIILFIVTGLVGITALSGAYLSRLRGPG